MSHVTPYGISEQELYLFNTGQSHHSYRFLGAHLIDTEQEQGVRFAVWAPQAAAIKVVGQFNNWDGSQHMMERIGGTGIWYIFIPGLGEGEIYKYEIDTKYGTTILKSDPYAFQSERRPNTASVVTNLDKYKWSDDEWLYRRSQSNSYQEKMLIYEVHLGSWKIHGKEEFYTYEELADSLVDYVVDLGYTHVELLPLTEHPLDASWGYQATGYYSATSRYGTPDQLKIFIDRCHKRNLGVILDWVPGHFCKDDFGLRQFDGTPIFEGDNWRKAEKPLWGTLAFDFAISEVQSFLISNAIFWMEVYHIDGLRVDAVASMIDLHFDKPEELFTLNKYGGKDNLDALEFLKNLNKTVFQYYPQALMIAEDSSAWPGVTSPTYLGGLGFNYKWNMGWMNDMLKYMETNPYDRMHHHNLITFSLMYAYSENYVLPFSHDEVVHGKKSLLNKMPGNYDEKFAQFRLLLGYWMTHPGKKLLFMGGEFGMFDEWKDADQLDWMVLGYDMHRLTNVYTTRLNHVYLSNPDLWERDTDPNGFEWVDVNNAAQSIIVFIRRGHDPNRFTLVVCNFSPHYYHSYRIGVPKPGEYNVLIHSGHADFGGQHGFPPLSAQTEDVPWHWRDQSITIDVPQFSFQMYEYVGKPDELEQVKVPTAKLKSIKKKRTKK